tara:strand:- start:703 stop:1734 length:1032 start_codon:yes stop_codon:yes gene_type:complete
MSQYQSPFGSGNSGNPWGGFGGTSGNNGDVWTQQSGSEMFDFMQGWNSQTPEQRASQQGYVPDPRNPGRFTTIGPGPRYTAGANRFANPPGGGSQWQQFAKKDLENIIGAGQANWQKRDDAHTAYLKSAEEGRDRMLAGGQAAEDKMLGFAEGVSGDTWARVDERMAGYDKVSAELEDYVSGLASSQQRAIQKRFESQSNQNMAGIKAGDPEAIANQQMLQSEANALSANTATTAFANYNQTNAQYSLAAEQGKTQALGVGMAAEQIASNMRARGVELNNQAQANAGVAWASGNATYAQLVASNQYTPVSFLSSLASFYEYSQTSGANEFTGFDDEFFAQTSY